MNKTKPLHTVLAVILGVVVLALILGGAYYQNDISTYVRLQAWDEAGVKSFVRDFVAKTHARDPAVEGMLDNRFLKAGIKGKKLATISHPSAGGPLPVAVGKFVPAKDVEEILIRVKYKAGEFEAAVKYPSGRWAAFGVARSDSGLKISKIPDDLSDSRPQPQVWD